MFITYFTLSLSQLGGEIAAQFGSGEINSGWSFDGFRYAMYNLSIVPAILFAARDIQTRKEAVLSGVIASFICITPAVLFHITFTGGYPAILDEEVPVYTVITELGFGYLLILYMVGLFGTFIETGAGFIQGINERIDSYLREIKGITLSKPLRALIAVVAIGISAGLATFGIIALIARGYGTIAWGFFAVYVIPIMTYGVYKIITHQRSMY